MVNFLERVLLHPEYYRQFDCGGSLITAFFCPMEARLMKNKFSDLWTKHNYLLYVVEGRKVWHTARGSYDIGKDSCVFVRKGGFILEQFWDTGFCVMLFFIPDEFICETLQSKAGGLPGTERNFEPLMLLESNERLKGFFISMSTYFSETREPDPMLLELKFKELVLNIADSFANKDLVAYFDSLRREPQAIVLRRVMEDNFCFNLKLEVYAELSNRSLSAFKRDFAKLFGCAPGKWLLEKRLHHALDLMRNRNRTVGEAAFESGFESPSHFSRVFKLRFGMAPAQMKQVADQV
jgi:AraC family transcriptional regulator, exoenzyme S synthesis regulatory protein ExsA